MRGFDFDAIRRDYPLDTIIAQTVKLRKSGANKVGRCPFHPDNSPSFVVYTDARYHCFGCGAHGDVIDFVSATQRVTTSEAIAKITGGEAPKLNAEDREKRQREIERQADEQKQRQQRAIENARVRWDKARPIDGSNNAYLIRKSIAPYVARAEGDNLLVPLFGSDGKVQTVQMIPAAEGERKLFHAGAPTKGAYCTIGDNDSGPIIVVEGYATGATVQQATGCLVAIAYSKAALTGVAKDIRRSHPERRLIIGADANGEEAAREAADAVGGTMVVPDLQGAEGTDFNDQAGHYGIDDVASTFALSDPIEGLPGGADPFEWEGKRAPHRQFIIPGWIVRGSAGLLSGQEGVGKSLIAQQMATCAALGRKFVGLDIARVNAMYVTCEDPIDELWRRQESINVALGCTMADLRGRLKLHSLVGEIGNELGTFDASGQIVPTKRYKQLVDSSIQFGAQLTILDNAAHMFAGNENVRHDVAAFLGLIERYSMTINGAAVLLAHPNKSYAQGNKQGNEYSGSTGWSAHVRNRLFIDYAPAPDSGALADPDERILRKSKANYGKRGEEVAFRWHEWAFVPATDIPPERAREISDIAAANHENQVFLVCLEKATAEKRTVSARPAASNYAPRVFAKMPSAVGVGTDGFERAMERLLHLETIIADAEIFKRGNRTWANGIALNDAENCTNPRTNHAQSDAQSLHKAAQSQPHTGALHSTPSSIEEGESATAPPPFFDDEGFFVAPDYDPADVWRTSENWEPDYE